MEPALAYGTEALRALIADSDFAVARLRIYF
jgi:hypothetical protein